ncbi:uncharacterized protein [Venturia canescens]|nr:uncharacterized protein LOC122417392 isoform X2 [Venturia canescens]XP_043286808.1 uncharacterized protein LOC122417392 isoform X2 [Venturia canescens]
MQGLACRKGRPASTTLLLPTLLLPAFVVGLATLANGECEFPASWAGEWFQSAKPVIAVNATSMGERTCIQREGDRYIVLEPSSNNEDCYRCMIANDRHENVIQFRDIGWCNSELTNIATMCEVIRSDDNFFTMVRLDSKPIACPFTGPPYIFSYNRGDKDCSDPPSLAESCTDESKLLLKYQACTDIDASESFMEELQCLATWRDGRLQYLMGTLKPFDRSAPGNEETFRCFLYEKYPHHQGGKVVYAIAESGESTCNGLNSLSEGSKIIKLMKVDKEHSKCKYPSWVTKHHHWRSLNGSRTYHFTSGNATLKVTSPMDNFHEEKLVCHNLEPADPNDSNQRNRVKLVAHITSGCDIGYVCMIFHKRSPNVIEIQQSSEKAIMPDACSQWDPSKMPYMMLITSNLVQKKCPQSGRYKILDFMAPSALSIAPGRQRRSGAKSFRTAEKMTWQEDNEDEECKFTHIETGCSSPGQSEMTISNTCEREQIAYSCFDNWEEDGTWYTIVSQKSGQPSLENDETLPNVVTFTCFSMRWVDTTAKLPVRGSNRHEQQEQELWLSRPARTCQRESTDQWTYRLSSQGVCEDVTRAAASAASSSSLSRISLVLAAGAAIVCKLLSR